MARAKTKWNGLCPSGRHGLDYPGQPCDLCPKRPKPSNARRQRSALIQAWSKLSMARLLRDAPADILVVDKAVSFHRLVDEAWQVLEQAVGRTKASRQLRAQVAREKGENGGAPATREYCSVVDSNDCRAAPDSGSYTRAVCYSCGEPACPGCSDRMQYLGYGVKRVCVNCQENRGLGRFAQKQK